MTKRAALHILSWEKLPEGQKTTDYSALIHPRDYTAAIAYNDYIAYQCMNDFLAHGLRVPEDIALIGFDDIRRCNRCFPRLTSISAKDPGVPKAASDLLIQLMQHAQTSAQRIVLPVTIHHDGTV